MVRTTLFVLAVALALSACASEPEIVVKWSKPGAAYETFVAVRDACVRDDEKQMRAFFIAGVRNPAKGSGLTELVNDIYSDFGWRDPALGGRIDAETFRRCMNARGWHVDPKGYAPPEGDEVAMGK